MHPPDIGRSGASGTTDLGILPSELQPSRAAVRLWIAGFLSTSALRVRIVWDHRGFFLGEDPRCRHLPHRSPVPDLVLYAARIIFPAFRSGYHPIHPASLPS